MWGRLSPPRQLEALLVLLPLTQNAASALQVKSNGSNSVADKCTDGEHEAIHLHDI